jgi:hypothetical protein
MERALMTRGGCRVLFFNNSFSGSISPVPCKRLTCGCWLGRFEELGRRTGLRAEVLLGQNLAGAQRDVYISKSKVRGHSCLLTAPMPLP